MFFLRIRVGKNMKSGKYIELFIFFFFWGGGSG